MRVIDILQQVVGTGLLIAGVIVFIIEILGVYKFKYVLNRMHAAAMGDTLGIGLSLVGLIILNGISFTSAKLALVIVFLWFASPVSSHLIARLETTTNEHLEEHCELPAGTAEVEDVIADRADTVQATVEAVAGKAEEAGKKEEQ